MGNFAILIETSMRIQSKLNEMMLGQHDETALFVILDPTSVLSTLRYSVQRNLEPKYISLFPLSLDSRSYPYFFASPLASICCNIMGNSECEVVEREEERRERGKEKRRIVEDEGGLEAYSGSKPSDSFAPASIQAVNLFTLLWPARR